MTRHIHGGQGRTSSDVEGDGVAALFIALAFLVLFAALALGEVMQ